MGSLWALLRADILTDLLLGREINGDPQTTVEVQVNLDAATLAGLADNPGELAGFGPIPAEMARELAAAARRWRAALIDEHTGQLKDLSIAYRPPAAARSDRPSPRPGLLLPGMPPTRPPLRPRPHHSPRPARTHRRRQSRRTVPDLRPHPEPPPF
ncbi:MAG: hypothetical protein DLM60_00485 [Pseudonocardiales bacterium]|nr:MAG: hypothetical protein DLM60_00485 [Pseudonocardiales bacterium]